VCTVNWSAQHIDSDEHITSLRWTAVLQSVRGAANTGAPTLLALNLVQPLMYFAFNFSATVKPLCSSTGTLDRWREKWGKE
jgi:hypothetical protein